MASCVRVEVYRPCSPAPFRHIKLKQAAAIVSSGRAEFIGAKAIRMVEKSTQVPSARSLQCEQADVYEAASVTSGARFFQGGLNRTEHQPARIQPFKGARVGHQ